MWETLLVHAFCPLQSGYHFVKFIPHSKKFLIIHACVTCHIPHGLCHPPWFCQFSDRCSLLLTIIRPGFAIRILLPQLRNPIYTHYTWRPPSGVSCARPEILRGRCYNNFLKYRFSWMRCRHFGMPGWALTVRSQDTPEGSCRENHIQSNSGDCPDQGPGPPQGLGPGTGHLQGRVRRMANCKERSKTRDAYSKYSDLRVPS